MDQQEMPYYCNCFSGHDNDVRIYLIIYSVIILTFQHHKKLRVIMISSTMGVDPNGSLGCNIELPEGLCGCLVD